MWHTNTHKHKKQHWSLSPILIYISQSHNQKVHNSTTKSLAIHLGAHVIHARHWHGESQQSEADFYRDLLGRAGAV